MTTTHKPATPLPNTGMLLPPVPYGATRFEVQRDANAETGNPARRVATFDMLATAEEYVHAANAYPRLVEALKIITNGCEEIPEGKRTEHEKAVITCSRAALAFVKEDA